MKIISGYCLGTSELTESTDYFFVTNNDWLRQ